MSNINYHASSITWVTPANTGPGAPGVQSIDANNFSLKVAIGFSIPICSSLDDWGGNISSPSCLPAPSDDDNNPSVYQSLPWGSYLGSSGDGTPSNPKSWIPDDGIDGVFTGGFLSNLADDHPGIYIHLEYWRQTNNEWEKLGQVLATFNSTHSVADVGDNAAIEFEFGSVFPGLSTSVDVGTDELIKVAGVFLLGADPEQDSIPLHQWDHTWNPGNDPINSSAYWRTMDVGDGIVGETYYGVQPDSDDSGSNDSGDTPTYQASTSTGGKADLLWNKVPILDDANPETPASLEEILDISNMSCVLVEPASYNKAAAKTKAEMLSKLHRIKNNKSLVEGADLTEGGNHLIGADGSPYYEYFADDDDGRRSYKLFVNNIGDIANRHALYELNNPQYRENISWAHWSRTATDETKTTISSSDSSYTVGEQEQEQTNELEKEGGKIDDSRGGKNTDGLKYLEKQFSDKVTSPSTSPSNLYCGMPAHVTVDCAGIMQITPGGSVTSVPCPDQDTPGIDKVYVNAVTGQPEPAVDVTFRIHIPNDARGIMANGLLSNMAVMWKIVPKTSYSWQQATSGATPPNPGDYVWDDLLYDTDHHELYAEDIPPIDYTSPWIDPETGVMSWPGGIEQGTSGFVLPGEFTLQLHPDGPDGPSIHSPWGDAETWVATVNIDLYNDAVARHTPWEANAYSGGIRGVNGTLDLHSEEVVGSSLSATLNREFVLAAVLIDMTVYNETTNPPTIWKQPGMNQWSPSYFTEFDLESPKAAGISILASPTPAEYTIDSHPDPDVIDNQIWPDNPTWIVEAQGTYIWGNQNTWGDIYPPPSATSTFVMSNALVNWEIVDPDDDFDTQDIASLSIGPGVESSSTAVVINDEFDDGSFTIRAYDNESSHEDTLRINLQDRITAIRTVLHEPSNYSTWIAGGGGAENLPVETNSAHIAHPHPTFGTTWDVINNAVPIFDYNIGYYGLKGNALAALNQWKAHEGAQDGTHTTNGHVLDVSQLWSVIPSLEIPNNTLGDHDGDGDEDDDDKLLAFNKGTFLDPDNDMFRSYNDTGQLVGIEYQRASTIRDHGHGHWEDIIPEGEGRIVSVEAVATTLSAFEHDIVSPDGSPAQVSLEQSYKAHIFGGVDISPHQVAVGLCDFVFRTDLDTLAFPKQEVGTIQFKFYTAARDIIANNYWTDSATTDEFSIYAKRSISNFSVIFEQEDVGDGIYSSPSIEQTSLANTQQFVIGTNFDNSSEAGGTPGIHKLIVKPGVRYAGDFEIDNGEFSRDGEPWLATLNIYDWNGTPLSTYVDPYTGENLAGKQWLNDGDGVTELEFHFTDADPDVMFYISWEHAKYDDSQITHANWTTIIRFDQVCTLEDWKQFSAIGPDSTDYGNETNAIKLSWPLGDAMVHTDGNVLNDSYPLYVTGDTGEYLTTTAGPGPQHFEILASAGIDLEDVTPWMNTFQEQLNIQNLLGDPSGAKQYDDAAGIQVYKPNTNASFDHSSLPNNDWAWLGDLTDSGGGEWGGPTSVTITWDTVEAYTNYNGAVNPQIDAINNTLNGNSPGFNEVPLVHYRASQFSASDYYVEYNKGEIAINKEQFLDHINNGTIQNIATGLGIPEYGDSITISGTVTITKSICASDHVATIPIELTLENWICPDWGLHGRFSLKGDTAIAEKRVFQSIIHVAYETANFPNDYPGSGDYSGSGVIDLTDLPGIDNTTTSSSIAKLVSIRLTGDFDQSNEFVSALTIGGVDLFNGQNVGLKTDLGGGGNTNSKFEYPRVWELDGSSTTAELSEWSAWWEESVSALPIALDVVNGTVAWTSEVPGSSMGYRDGKVLLELEINGVSTEPTFPRGLIKEVVVTPSGISSEPDFFSASYTSDIPTNTASSPVVHNFSFDASGSIGTFTGTVKIFKIMLAGDFSSSSEELFDIVIGGTSFPNLSTGADSNSSTSVWGQDDAGNVTHEPAAVAVVGGLIEVTLKASQSVNNHVNVNFAWKIDIICEALGTIAAEISAFDTTGADSSGYAKKPSELGITSSEVEFIFLDATTNDAVWDAGAVQQDNLLISNIKDTQNYNLPASLANCVYIRDTGSFSRNLGITKSASDRLIRSLPIASVTSVGPGVGEVPSGWTDTQWSIHGAEPAIYNFNNNEVAHNALSGLLSYDEDERILITDPQFSGYDDYNTFFNSIGLDVWSYGSWGRYLGVVKVQHHVCDSADYEAGTGIDFNADGYEHIAYIPLVLDVFNKYCPQYDNWITDSPGDPMFTLSSSNNSTERDEQILLVICSNSDGSGDDIRILPYGFVENTSQPIYVHSTGAATTGDGTGAPGEWVLVGSPDQADAGKMWPGSTITISGNNVGGTGADASMVMVYDSQGASSPLLDYINYDSATGEVTVSGLDTINDAQIPAGTYYATITLSAFMCEEGEYSVSQTITIHIEDCDTECCADSEPERVDDLIASNSFPMGSTLIVDAVALATMVEGGSVLDSGGRFDTTKGFGSESYQHNYLKTDCEGQSMAIAGAVEAVSSLVSEEVTPANMGTWSSPAYSDDCEASAMYVVCVPADPNGTYEGTYDPDNPYIKSAYVCWNNPNNIDLQVDGNNDWFFTFNVNNAVINEWNNVPGSRYSNYQPQNNDTTFDVPKFFVGTAIDSDGDGNVDSWQRLINPYGENWNSGPGFNSMLVVTSADKATVEYRSKYGDYGTEQIKVLARFNIKAGHFTLKNFLSDEGALNIVGENLEGAGATTSWGGVKLVSFDSLGSPAKDIGCGLTGTDFTNQGISVDASIKHLDYESGATTFPTPCGSLSKPLFYQCIIGWVNGPGEYGPEQSHCDVTRNNGIPVDLNLQTEIDGWEFTPNDGQLFASLFGGTASEWMYIGATNGFTCPSDFGEDFAGNATSCTGNELMPWTDEATVNGVLVDSNLTNALWWTAYLKIASVTQTWCLRPKFNKSDSATECETVVFEINVPRNPFFDFNLGPDVIDPKYELLSSLPPDIGYGAIYHEINISARKLADGDGFIPAYSTTVVGCDGIASNGLPYVGTLIGDYINVGLQPEGIPLDLDQYGTDVGICGCCIDHTTFFKHMGYYCFGETSAQYLIDRGWLVIGEDGQEIGLTDGGSGFGINYGELTFNGDGTFTSTVTTTLSTEDVEATSTDTFNFDFNLP